MSPDLAIILLCPPLLFDAMVEDQEQRVKEMR